MKHGTTMLEITSEMEVEASRQDAWELISDFEGVWEASNPSHRGTKVLSEPKQPIREGLQWWQRERLGPLLGEFTATVREVIPGHCFRWVANAEYFICKLTIPIREGGTFTIEPTDAGCLLRHNLWGEFPKGVHGRLLEWSARHLLNCERAMEQHNLVELDYFRQRLEGKNSW